MGQITELHTPLSKYGPCSNQSSRINRGLIHNRVNIDKVAIKFLNIKGSHCVETKDMCRASEGKQLNKKIWNKYMVTYSANSAIRLSKYSWCLCVYVV